MFYYFIPRCDVDGSITFRGDARPVAKGQGWYDHEFGGPREEAGAVSPQLQKPDPKNEGGPTSRGTGSRCSSTTAGADGVRARARRHRQDPLPVGDPHRPGRRAPDYKSLTFKPARVAGVALDAHVPRLSVALALSVPEAASSCRSTPRSPTRSSSPASPSPRSGRGACRCAARSRGQQVGGLGYIERTGFEPVKDLDEFFAAVGEEVRKSVRDADAARAFARRGARRSSPPTSATTTWTASTSSRSRARCSRRCARSPIAAASPGARTPRSRAATSSRATRASSSSGSRCRS